MRSRPDLKLYLSPAEPVPGTRLLAQAVLLSRSETPIHGVEAHLVGREQRQVGKSYQSYEHVSLRAQTSQAVLTPGEHRFDFAFDIPPGLPPRYHSQTTSIVYDLHVRVDIPWWPDRSARYVVPLAATPAPAVGPSGAYCTDVRGPQGTALYLEASLESSTVALGSAFRGAVSVANVAHHRLRRLELALVHTERGRDAYRSVVEEQRYVVELCAGAPAEAQPVRFHVGLPADAPTSFVGGLIEVCWFLELRAVVALGSDVTLSIPVQVVRAAAGAPLAAQAAHAPVPRVPPVGRERRALLWAESARRNGLLNDAEDERMTLDLGGATLSITLEPRKAGSLALTATVAWPRLGIDLAVAERRWLDAWSGGQVAVDVPGVAERFTVRGREAAQVRAFLDEPSCRWLLLFDEAAVGDEGATLVSAGTAQSLEELDAFVARAVSAARALAEVAGRVPPPAAMAAFAPAWRAFAAALGGQLTVGEMSIHEVTFEEAPMELVTEWTKEGAPSATVARFALPEREGGEKREAGAVGPGAAGPHLDGQAQALVDSLTPQVTALEITERAVTARLPAPAADPAALEPILAGLGRLSRRLSGGVARGPYR